MVNFNYEADFKLNNEEKLEHWINDAVSEENFKLGDVNYIFCTDPYLHKLNVEFLGHDTLTDIISFDYTVGKIIQGDIFISVERVQENATYYNVDFNNELLRVMIHGILHFCGYKDKTDGQAKIMRSKEEYYMVRY
ncbi:rRNA maturation RNase YbeY [Winogradskyella alexanderae]|uniref:Endoribonuclease YbeY n=1 Tax=Winogradskyella alexanderae TaxID=2877123 RepID=A0ABS7XP83_9FLAO|nr:rRNA maturation RNase YbeY [Winogradskyella alexanderae]MCA0131273.1 rRNA maturation RNase YbeY [Winogradskyella alexanderae]